MTTTDDALPDVTDEERDRRWPNGWEYHHCHLYNARVTHAVTFHGPHSPLGPARSPNGMPLIAVKPFSATNLMYWEDGKPRCRTHRAVLTRANLHGTEVDLPDDLHVCASCLKEAYDDGTWPNGARP